MSLAAVIRRQGFNIRAIENGALYVEPIDKLTPDQLDWLKANKAQIRHELLTERWQWFLSLATNHGIHPDLIEAEFATEQDRLDVIEPIEHTDEILKLCMQTLCKKLNTNH